MPSRKRSISITAAFFGMLTVVTVFAMSSVGLKADNATHPASVATTPMTTPAISSYHKTFQGPQMEVIHPYNDEVLRSLMGRYQLTQEITRCSLACDAQHDSCRYPRALLRDKQFCHNQLSECLRRCPVRSHVR